MDYFVHAANIALYRKLIAESELDPSRDENRHAMLLTLLAEEIDKEKIPPNSQTLAVGDTDDRCADLHQGAARPVRQFGHFKNKGGRHEALDRIIGAAGYRVDSREH